MKKISFYVLSAVIILYFFQTNSSNNFIYPKAYPTITYSIKNIFPSQKRHLEDERIRQRQRKEQFRKS